MGDNLSKSLADFVLDAQQRVVEWSAELIPPRLAVGRRCYEVLQGQDGSGRSICGPLCPAFEALRRGRLRARQALERSCVPEPAACELTALPPLGGGAVGRLRPLAAPAKCAGPWNALAAMAALGHRVRTENLSECLDQSLEIVRQAVAAEAAEGFLADPRAGQLLLTSYRGPWRRAFFEKLRFQPGQGIPGLVLARQQIIATDVLTGDGRFLRTGVKRRGFAMYVCGPLAGPHGLLGAMGVADRRHLDLQAAARMLAWASLPVSTALEACLLRLHLRLEEEFAASSADSEEDLLRWLLGAVVAVGEGSGGSLVLPPTGSALRRHVGCGDFASGICPTLDSDPQRCAVLADRQAAVLAGSRGRWPSACRRSPCPGPTLCLPLVHREQPLGVVQVAYTGRVPSPLTRPLPSLLAAAEWAAAKLHRLLDARPRRPRLAAQAPTPQAEPCPLELRCLGRFEVYREGHPVPPKVLGRRKALKLLKILLTLRGRPVSWDRLAEGLWPESEPNAGRNRLHVLMHYLRRALEPSGRRSGWTFLQCDGDHFRLELETSPPVRLDVRDFEQCLAAAESAAGPGAARDGYEAAVRLYRGDYLEDEPYEPWCAPERDRLREMYVLALRRLSALLARLGEPESSVTYARQALAAEPAREELHRELMLRLWSGGRPDDALRQFELCREVLRRDLGVDPAAATLHLVGSILAGGPPPNPGLSA